MMISAISETGWEESLKTLKTSAASPDARPGVPFLDRPGTAAVPKMKWKTVHVDERNHIEGSLANFRGWPSAQKRFTAPCGDLDRRQLGPLPLRAPTAAGPPRRVG